MSNYTLIYVRPTVFGTNPILPTVVGGFEPLKIGVRWDLNDNQWESVTVQNFMGVDGQPITVHPASHEFLLSNGDARQEFEFPFVDEDVFVKYDLVYRGVGGHPILTIDPTVLVKRVGPNPGSGSDFSGGSGFSKA